MKVEMKKKKIVVLVVILILLAIVGYGVYSYYFQGGTHISRSEIWKYSYVASNRSDVYHSHSCRWVQKISAENLIGFKSRDEAEKSGRRPCKVCKP